VKTKSIFAMCCAVGLTTGAVAQNIEFTNYLGFISTTTSPLPLAADPDGRLFYGTFNTNAVTQQVSELRVIPSPTSVLNSSTSEGLLIDTYPEFDNGRGIQSLDVTPNGTVFVGGDTGGAARANVWKYNRTSVTPLIYTEDVAFNTQVAATSPKRRSGVAIVNSSGDGLLATTYFTGVDFFDFSGNFLANLGGGSNYMREPVYNSANNVLYPIRNGASSNNMIDYIFTGFNTTNGTGGSLVPGTLIPDGAANGAFGNSAQNGFYYAAQNQLITVDGPTVQLDPPRVRVWNIADNGTSLSLAYSIDADPNGLPFTGIADAVVSGNNMYVSNTSRNAIYVYGGVPASVSRWDAYESSK
jgi:hypothetical protein